MRVVGRDCRASPRSAPRAPPTARARAPRPRRAPGPRAPRATRPGTAPAAGGGAAPRARPASRCRSASRPCREVRDEPELVELLHHARRGRGRHAEPLGERVRRDRPAAALLERVDRLRIVLDRLATAAFTLVAIRRSPAGSSRRGSRSRRGCPATLAGYSARPERSRIEGTSCWITCTIAPAPAPSRKAATLELNAEAPIQAPRIAGRAGDQAEQGKPAEAGGRCRHGRDDRESLGGVVQREADHQEGTERQRADRVRGADRESLAEVVQPDRDRHQQRDVASGARPRSRLAAMALRATTRRRQHQVGRSARRGRRAPGRQAPASPARRRRVPRASRRSRGSRAARS